MKELLIRQIEFEHWANNDLLSSMRQAGTLNDRALSLFSHMHSASSMWLSRVKGEPMTTTLWQERTLDECEALFKENTERWLAYINSASDLELKRIVEFIFVIDGSKKRMSVADSVLHVVHHSSYHRGQIITLLKGSIEKLPLVTYIMFASETVAG